MVEESSDKLCIQSEKQAFDSPARRELLGRKLYQFRLTSSRYEAKAKLSNWHQNGWQV